LVVKVTGEHNRPLKKDLKDFMYERFDSISEECAAKIKRV